MKFNICFQCEPEQDKSRYWLVLSQRVHECLIKDDPFSRLLQNYYYIFQNNV